MTDKIIFSTYTDIHGDSIALQGPGLDEVYSCRSAEFEVTLPMDGVSIRGNRTVGYQVRVKVFFENGSWHFALESPGGVQVSRIDER